MSATIIDGSAISKVILAEIKWRRDVGTDVALFSIIAMPKAKTVAAAGSDKEGS